MNWKNINKCQHEWGTYYDSGHCATPYCTWEELRCLKCRVYHTRCMCHYEDGFGGEPRKKWLNRVLKKEHSKCRSAK